MNYQLTPKRKAALAFLAFLIIVFILIQTGVIFGETELPEPTTPVTPTP